MAVPEPPARHPGFDPIDRVYAGLRLAALLAGLAYAYLSGLAEAVRFWLLVALGGFAMYSIVLYAGGWILFYTRVKGRFYTHLAALDFVFVMIVMHLTGGAASPLYRALFLWVAMVSFYFGAKGGAVSASLALVAFVWFFSADPEGPWELAVKVGGLVVHGPLIGILIERDRRLMRQVQRLRERLDEPVNAEGQEGGTGAAARGEERAPASSA